MTASLPVNSMEPYPITKETVAMTAPEAKEHPNWQDRIVKTRRYWLANSR